MIGIIGLGFVGNAIYKSLLNKKIDNIKKYDKFKDGGIGSLEECLDTEILFLCLPTPFNDKNKDTIRNNIMTTKKAREHLQNNGLLIIFPSGSVSVARTLKSSAKDDNWKQFTAKIIKLHL